MQGTINVNEWFPETELGTAVHAALARYVAVMPVDIGAIARLYGVDESDLGYLFSQGRKAWAEIMPPDDCPVNPEIPLHASLHLAEPRADGATNLWDVDLTGTADVIVLREGGRVVEITDWKSGRTDSDYREQVLGYCVLALKNYPAAEVATARLVWLRGRGGGADVEMYSLRRDEAEMWVERLMGQVKSETYRPGGHCQYCPRKFDCQARVDMSKASLAVLGAESHRALQQLTGPEQIALYKRAKDVQRLTYQVIDEVKALVESAGPIEGNGVRLEMVEEQRRKLLPGPAWPVLQRLLTDEGLEAAVSVSITKAEDAVAKGAPRGQGAARKRELAAELEAAGAVQVDVAKKLTERRT
jgi:hypothetical protein